APRSQAAFEKARDAYAAVVVDETFSVVSLAARIISLSRDVEKAVKGQNSLTLLGALNDVKAQLAGLVFPGFLSRVGVTRLAHLPRYLQGARDRVTGLADNPGRDRQRQSEYERSAAAFADAGGTIPLAPSSPDNLVRVRWMLEEYRVSLF
ncbi:MAG TPA: ATP-dependent helicase, partial [Microbacterium sp.]|nr:ATP-dependent helicase [Microbacterium sp.]